MQTKTLPLTFEMLREVAPWAEWAMTAGTPWLEATAPVGSPDLRLRVRAWSHGYAVEIVVSRFDDNVDDYDAASLSLHTAKTLDGVQISSPDVASTIARLRLERLHESVSS